MFNNTVNVEYLKKLTILYIEDDTDALEQTEFFLSKYCTNILTATNGMDGIDLYNKFEPDIIISDIRMPILDGISMIKEIRNTNIFIPIILITAYDQNSYLKESINLSIDGYITKPIEPFILIERILKCVHRIRIEEELKNSLFLSRSQEYIISTQKQELELIIKGSRSGTWSLDVLSGDMIFNDQWYNMLGYKEGELNPHLDTIYTLIHKDDLNYVRSSFEDHLSGKTPSLTIEHRFYHKSGRIIWVYILGQVLLHDKKNFPLRAFGMQIDITTQKEAFKRISEAEKESNAIIQNFLDILFVVNSDMQIVRINKATCKTLGYEENEILMRPISCLFNDEESLIHQKFKLGCHQPLRNIEFNCLHKNGNIIPMSFNISPLWNDNNHNNLAIAGAKDISQLRYSLNETERHKVYIENLVSMLPVGLLTLTQSWKHLNNNNKFNELINDCAEKCALSKEYFFTELTEKLRKKQNEKESFNIKINNNKNSVYLKCRIEYLNNENSIYHEKNGEYIITLIDITNEKQIEKENSFLSLAIKQSNYPIFISDFNEMIIYANNAAIENIAESDKEIIGKNLYDIILFPANHSISSEIKQTLHNKKVWNGNIRSELSPSSFKEEELAIFLVIGEDSSSNYIVAIKKDITEVVNLQRQLALAQKMEAIGQLASGIAHEINSPIQYVINNIAFIQQAYTDIHPLLHEINRIKHYTLPSTCVDLIDKIQFDYLVEEIPQSLDEAFEGINRVATIISALRRFSHPGEGEKVLTDLNQALESALIVCRHEWKYVAELVTDYAQNLPEVPCFPDQLNQVFFNLIINAAHAIEASQKNAPDKRATITVGTRLCGDMVEISIADTGCGIPKELNSRIFEPFFTTKAVGKGTGQGLAIAHDIIVQKHGGKIAFTSEPGKGTTFFLHLPFSAPNIGNSLP